MLKLEKIILLMSELAPTNLAYDWDNVGLQIGDRNKKIDKILLTLDITKEIIEEAIDNQCQLIISHHPLIFQGINSINKQNPLGQIIYQAIKNDLAIFSAHTNLDLSRLGLNNYLAKILNLNNIAPLDIEKTEKYYKLVVFIPETHFSQVKTAILDAGAGNLGNYSYTSFASEGEGTFKPLKGSKPFLGKKAEINKVKELRLETIITENNKEKIIKQLLQNHPYEEVAYDLYPLLAQGERYGLGCVGDLNKNISLDDFLKILIKKLDLVKIKYVGEQTKLIKKVALCSGSGGSLVKKAIKAGVDVYLTGDIKYHQAHLAAESDLSLIDIGHYHSEIIVRDLFYNFLVKKIEDLNLKIKLIKSKINTNPWNYYD